MARWPGHGGNPGEMVNEECLLGLEKKKGHLKFYFKHIFYGSEHSSAKATLVLIGTSLLEFASLTQPRSKHSLLLRMYSVQEL